MRGLVCTVTAMAAGCSPPSVGTQARPEPLIPGWPAVTAYLDSVVAAGAAPGAVLAVSWRGGHAIYGTGRLGLDDRRRPDAHTLYDLASLTKVIGLTTAVLLAVEEGRLVLDAPIQAYVPEFQGPGKDAVTVRHLLTHSSGLPAWRPLFRETASRAAALALTDTTPLESRPGTRTVYSDLGAIVLTQAVERVQGQRIDSLLERRLFQPLGMRSTRYRPPAEWQSRIAPTENDPWRGRTLRGEVHDENAARLEGVSGHAGLFSDAEDLLQFSDWLLDAWAEEVGEAEEALEGQKPRCGPSAAAATPATPAPSVLPVCSALLREFTRRQRVVPEATRALGWDTPAAGSSSGSRLSPSSFGHTGFTGTSIWLDPERRLAIVLLSNRVHPTRQNNAWTGVRGALADRVVAALGGRGFLLDPQEVGRGIRPWTRVDRDPAPSLGYSLLHRSEGRTGFLARGKERVWRASSHRSRSPASRSFSLTARRRRSGSSWRPSRSPPNRAGCG